MWEHCGSKACSRWLKYIQHCCKLAWRYREQALLPQGSTTASRVGLQPHHILSLQALLPFHDRVLDLLAFGQ